MTVLAGRYELLEQVGEGGMGVVWRAHDEKLGRDVAIKLLRAFVADEPEQRRRFDREARTLAGLANDHIVRIYDYVDDGDQAFLVMEFVDGGNLAETTFGRLPLSFAEAAAYTAPVAKALAYAHAKGVVHRDLTPGNILIERESGRVVTTDFGLARIARSAGSLTASGFLIGTPEYWSPEQAMGRESDITADMYALGCILFQLLSGRLPFEGDDRLALGLRRAHEDAPSLASTVPEAPAAAVTLVDSLLAREAARRPDASAAAAALDRRARSARRPPTGLGAAGAGSRSTTAVLPAENPTAQLPAAAATLPLSSPPPPSQPSPPAPPRRRGPRRLVVAAFAAAAATTAVALIVADELREPVVRAPNVVALRESAARAQILHVLPAATVSVTRVYSTRIASGRVIGQRPPPDAQLRGDVPVRLTVSKGTPFAPVPSVAAGVPPATAKALLERRGFIGRYRYTPSWTIRKGTVIELRPGTGTRLRRPATVRIVVASGYPRSVVPDVENVGLSSAQTQLEAKHLRYHVVYRLTQSVAPNQVLGQSPAAGAVVYQGSRIRLTVARTLRWVKVFAGSGADLYESAPFTVPDRWRIRYRLTAGDFGPALARVSWSHDGNLFGDGSFIADGAGPLRTYAVSDGAGTYKLTVSPYVGTAWYVEVDALE
jgi:serine/threonine protein kinase/beta-lactam-binding protein with PASTA domain